MAIWNQRRSDAAEVPAASTASRQLVRKWLTAPPPTDYLEALHRWTVFNDVRSAAAVFGFVLILVADALMDTNTVERSLL
jgi:hypothetical protein